MSSNVAVSGKMGGDSDTSTDPEDESQLREFLKFINEYFELEQKMFDLKNFVLDHPILTLFFMVTIVMCSVPVIGFILFAIGSAMFGAVVFLFFEGTVLSVAALVLGGVLLVTVLMATGLSTFLVGAYYLAQGIRYLYFQITGNTLTLPAILDDDPPESQKTK